MAASHATDSDIREYAEAITAFVNQKNFDAAARKKLTDILGSYPPSTLVKMIEYKPYIGKFVQSDPELTKKWANYLKEQHFYNGEIKPMHSDSHCSIFERYVGFYYFNLWKNPPANQPRDRANLDKACANNLFEALKARAEINVANIKSGNNPDNSARKQLLADAETLSDLYWIPGTIQAALLLTEVGNFYADQEDSQAALSTPYFEDALDFFLTVKELMELDERHELDEVNTDIANYIYEGKNVKTILENKFTSLSQAHSFFCQKTHLQPSDQRYAELAQHAHARVPLHK